MSRAYIKGFNEGYFMTQYLPELAEAVAEADSTSPRMEGFRDGRAQYMLDYTRELRPAWLRGERNANAPSDRAEPMKQADQEKGEQTSSGRDQQRSIGRVQETNRDKNKGRDLER